MSCSNFCPEGRGAALYDCLEGSQQDQTSLMSTDKQASLGYKLLMYEMCVIHMELNGSHSYELFTILSLHELEFFQD